MSVWPHPHPNHLSDPELFEQLGRCITQCVVECATCAIVHRFDDLAADASSMPPRLFMCPLCRGNLVDAVRDHLRTCRRAQGVTRTP